MNPPDRLSVDKNSPYYDKSAIQRVEVYLDGVRQINTVKEYCVSERWLDRIKKTATGQMILDESGNVQISRHYGEICVEWKAS